MNDYKYELTDLDTNDKFAALVLVLIEKHIITEQDIMAGFEAVLKTKNDNLAKYLEENPAMTLLFDMGGFNKKGDTDGKSKDSNRSPDPAE